MRLSCNDFKVKKIIKGNCKILCICVCVCFFLLMYEIIFLLDFVQFKFLKDHPQKNFKSCRCSVNIYHTKTEKGGGRRE